MESSKPTVSSIPSGSTNNSSGKKTSSKILIIALAILAILFFSAISYYLGKRSNPILTVLPTSIPTSISKAPPVTPNNKAQKWKTYHNYMYEYSFKYPSSSIIKDWGGIQAFESRTTLTVLDARHKNADDAQIYIEVSHTKSSLADFIKNYKEGGANWGRGGLEDITDLPDQSFGTIQAKVISSTGSRVYFFLNENIVIMITKHSASEEASNDTINDIVSSFRIIKDADDVRNWPTFKDRSTEISIKYPPSWTTNKLDTNEAPCIYEAQNDKEFPYGTKSNVCVNIIERSASETSLESIEKYLNATYKQDLVYLSKNPLDFGSNSSWRIEFLVNVPQTTHNIYYFFVNKSNLNKLGYVKIENYQYRNDAIYNAIVPTFTF